MSPSLLHPKSIEIKLGPYGVAAAHTLADPNILLLVQDYRRRAGASMYPLEPHDISRKLAEADYFVSRKIDGEFTAVHYQEGEVFTVNPGGTVRIGLPVLEEVGEQLRRASIGRCTLAAELYVDKGAGIRERIHDLLPIVRHPQSLDQLDSLRLAIFDVIEIDGQSPGGSFAETWKFLEQTFGQGIRSRPVPTQRLRTAHDVVAEFATQVEKQGAEGLVVRSDHAGVFKIKARHTLDAVVIGFTESTGDRQGMLHDLLLAMVRGDGALHVLCRVGGGFSDSQRQQMLGELRRQVVESEYAEVNSDHVAYQMVRPEWVVEISCLDLISQTTRGAPVNRMVLNWNPREERYQIIRRLPLVSVISPQFIRRREDKRAIPADVRIQQISHRVEIPLVDRPATQMALPKSQLLRRAVYTKSLKGETMVRKFLMWKTNKDLENEMFPAFVIHFTDYSPNRQVALNRDVRISNSPEQIEDLWRQMVAENIKQGWSLHSESLGHPDGHDDRPLDDAEVVEEVAEPGGDPEIAPTVVRELKPRRQPAKKKGVHRPPADRKTTRPAAKKTTRKKK